MLEQLAMDVIDNRVQVENSLGHPRGKVSVLEWPESTCAFSLTQCPELSHIFVNTLRVIVRNRLLQSVQNETPCGNAHPSPITE